jgi:hypothetical protein
MIGDLLKELSVALWRYFRYHLGRLTGFHHTRIPQAMQGPLPISAVADAQGIAPPPEETMLSAAYRRPVRWGTSRRDLDSEELARNPVLQFWKQHKPRAHKWTHYFETYHAIFGPHRLQARRILEIGVYQGASLRLWRQYFENTETVLVGIDLDQTCARFDSPRENVHVRIGNQADAVFLEAVARDFGPFDIIIDDGSHRSSHMIASFNHLFASALKDDGIYLVEDLHANYWTAWRDTRYSFLDLCKELMELMHSHYSRAQMADWLRESESDSESDPLLLDVPVIATMIKEIRVFDSIVAIYKTRREYLPRVLDPAAG